MTPWLRRLEVVGLARPRSSNDRRLSSVQCHRSPHRAVWSVWIDSLVCSASVLTGSCVPFWPCERLIRCCMNQEDRTEDGSLRAILRAQNQVFQCRVWGAVQLGNGYYLSIVSRGSCCQHSTVACLPRGVNGCLIHGSRAGDLSGQLHQPVVVGFHVFTIHQQLQTVDPPRHGKVTPAQQSQPS
jgi:hypothetical protein